MNKTLIDHWQEEQELRACFCLLHSILVEITEGPNAIDEKKISLELWHLVNCGEQALNRLFESENRGGLKNE